MVDLDHPDRTRDVLNTVPRSILQNIFRFWASYGYTTRSVLFAQEKDFDQSDPMNPAGYGWHEVKNSGWMFLLMAHRIPEGRGGKEHRAMLRERDEAIKKDQKIVL